jgi:hypothetical protein
MQATTAPQPIRFSPARIATTPSPSPIAAMMSGRTSDRTRIGGSVM